MWDNPYAGNQAKTAAAEENRRRVQRMKEERAFIVGMHENYKLKHMDEVREQLKEKREKKLIEQETHVDPEKAAAEPSESDAIDPMKCVCEFKANVRALEIAHGGATLWTGEDDGSIGIRNGVTGDLVYVIDRHEDGHFVDTLFFSDTQMWVGLSSGTVRVYDAHVFILAYESQVHTKSVTAFTKTFDGKVFSSSVDGTIAKWETEGSSLEVAAHLTGNTTALRSITSYGYNLFAAADDHLIHCLDTETGATTTLFEGHQAPVTSVLVLNGMLASASEDGTVAIWNISSGEREQVLDHGQPVNSLMSDNVAQTIWSADSKGVIRLWSFRKGAFHLHRVVEAGQDASIVSLKGIVAIDALKIWTMGSNGDSRVWHAANNRIEDAVRNSLRSMQAIIAEDEVELAKWSELIKTMEEVFLRLKQSIASNLSLSSQRLTQQEVFLKWQRYVLFSHMRKTKQLLSERLEKSSHNAHRKASFVRLLQYLQQKKTERSKEAAVTVLNADHRRRMTTVYFAKMRLFYHTLREAERKKTRGEVLLKSTQGTLASKYYFKFKQFIDHKRMRRKQAQVALSMLAGSNNQLLQVYYQKMKKYVSKRRAGNESSRMAVALQSTRNKLNLGYYFAKWMKWKSVMTNRRAEGKTVMHLLQQGEKWLMQTYYNKWLRFTSSSLTEMHLRNTADGESTVSDLQSQLDEIEHLVRRRRLLDDAQRAINAALADRLRKEEKIKALNEEAAAIQQAIEEKRETSKKAREQSVAEQIADLIAELKCKCINVHNDFTLMAKVVEKSKHVKAPNIFLENHQAVKRVVVELTKQPYLSAEEVWPLSPELIKQIKSHQIEQILVAVKTMIITFDIMSPQDKANLHSDKEIVLNAHWIHSLTDHCTRVKLKRLGAGAFRAK